MSRVESSKESLRNSTIPDADGSSEVYGVTLTPNRWATYCKRKAQGWYERNGNFTLAQIHSEIARLESLQASYESADTLVRPGEDGKRQYPAKDAENPKVDPGTTKQEVTTCLNALYVAQAGLSGAKYDFEQVLGDKNATQQQKGAAKKKVEDAQKDVVAAQKKLKEAEDADRLAPRNMNEYNRMILDGSALEDAEKWIASKKGTIQSELKRLNDMRAAEAQKSPVEIPVISGVAAPKEGEDPMKVPTGTDLATTGCELANPIFKSPSPPGGDPGQPLQDAGSADPWTAITFSYSASDLSSHQKKSEWGMKVGGSVGFGLWSVGCSYSHDESQVNAERYGRLRHQCVLLRACCENQSPLATIALRKFKLTLLY